MNRRILILTALLIGSIGFSLQGQTIQSRKAWLAAADSALSQKDYYPAFKFYEAALAYDSTATDVWFKYAESARSFNAYTFAEKGYLKVIGLDQPGQFPEAHLWLAQVRQKIGKYADALSDYQAYIDRPATQRDDWMQLARKGLADCTWAMERMQTRSFTLPPRNLGPGINNAYSDFGAAFLGDTVFYSSFRYQKDQGKAKRQSQRPMIRVLRSDNGTEALLLSDSFNLPNQHIAYSAFTPDGQGVYYTVCEYINASDIRCDLYFRKRLGPDQWGAPLRLSVNQNGYTSTQPSVAVVQGSQQPWLFFASDRPGGKGAMDIWYGAIQPNGDVQQAQNLEALNTSSNDIAPFFHNISQQLYFSTEGRESLGGYDIFRSKYREGAWTEPKPLPDPVNSSYDDVYYTLNTAGDKAIFSSNRWGSTFIEAEKEACCYDLYEVLIDLGVILDVFTFNRQDSVALAGSTVYVYEITPEGEKLVATTTNPNGNNYEFELQRNKKYRVVAQKDDFISAEAIVDLGDLEDGQDRVRQDLYLDPLKVNLTALTFDADDMSPLKGARVELYEIVDGDTTLVGDLVNELGNDFNFMIDVNRPYVIKASKPGYDSLLVPFIITTEDVRRLGREITVELPLERIDFPELPIAFYFDNASPDGRSLSRTTNADVKALGEVYYSRKKEFIDRFTEGLNPEQKFVTAQLYDNFFEREVKGGLENLIVFSNQLLNYLGRGNAITIELQGYASPRASAAFNEIISARRTKAVVNFFMRYKDGAFLPYLKNGQFEIIERAFGESKAKSGVPDRLDDIKGSVYSLLASLERRVEIIKVRTRIVKQQ